MQWKIFLIIKCNIQNHKHGIERSCVLFQTVCCFGVLQYDNEDGLMIIMIVIKTIIVEMMRMILVILIMIVEIIMSTWIMVITMMIIMMMMIASPWLETSLWR